MHDLRFRFAARIAAMLLALGTIAAPPAAFAQDAKVTVGTVNAISDAPLFIAQARGFFEQEHITVEFTTFDSAAKMIAPLGAGQLDVGGGSPSAGLYNAVERGIEIKVVADKGSTPPGYGYNPLMIRKALIASGRVKSLHDLKGLTLADAAQGAGSTSTLNEALKKGGLSLGDVKNVKMGFPDMVTAMQNGSIDGGIVSEPAASEAVSLGVAVRFMPSDQFYPNQQIAALLYSGTFMKTRPDIAKRFMVAYIRALRYYNDALKDGHFNGSTAPSVIAILIKDTPVKDPKIYKIITPNGANPNGTVNVASMNKDLDLFKKLGLVTGSITAEQVVDLSYVTSALATLKRER